MKRKTEKKINFNTSTSAPTDFKVENPHPQMWIIQHSIHYYIYTYIYLLWYWNFLYIASMCLWCSGYHVCLTHRRSLVRAQVGTVVFWRWTKISPEFYELMIEKYAWAKHNNNLLITSEWSDRSFTWITVWKFALPLHTTGTIVMF